MNVRLMGLVLGAVAVFIGVIAIAGQNPLEVIQQLFRGALGSERAITKTFEETTPLLLAGVGVFLALRAGLFNIGIEGQFLVGAMCAAAAGLAVPGPMQIPVAILAGMVGGALWAFPAGWIKAYRNGHEVITTIMLNNIAGFLAGALVAGPLKDPNQGKATTAVLAGELPTIQIGKIGVNVGLFIGMAFAGALWWWLKYRVAGYELRAVGANPTAATYAGVDARRVIVRAMSASGAIGGLAGAVQVLAYEHRFYAEFSPGYGFDSLGVALLAAGNAWLVMPAAFLFGILAEGGRTLQFMDLPRGLTTVVLGLVILVAAAIRYRREAAGA